MEWNMGTIQATASTLRTMREEDAYNQMGEELGEFYEAVMEAVTEQVFNAGYELVPSTQMGRGCVEIYRECDGVRLGERDFEVETEEFLEFAEEEDTFEEVVRLMVRSYVELAQDLAGVFVEEEEWA